MGLWNYGPLGTQVSLGVDLFHGGQCVMAWLHQLAMKPRDSCGPGEHCLRYSVFYCTVCVTEAELFEMFEFP